MWYPNWILKMCKHGPAVASYYHLDQIHTSDHWFHCPASTPSWALLICHFSPGSLCSRRGWTSFSEEYFSQLLPQGFCLNWLVYRGAASAYLPFSLHFREAFGFHLKIYTSGNMSSINSVHSSIHPGPWFTSVLSHYFGKIYVSLVYLFSSLSY